ncbi:putative glyoxalase/bleomycin resistance protein/dioxygenase [Chytriomyces sp. MP71]|nr:putative glyoxalase/bleomycin resistance protein/dioxygenase [Chytriomyces sp. MP71]
MPPKFGYTILYVADVEASVAFWERAFGFQRRFVHESGYAELETGSTALAFASFTLASSHGFAFDSAATAPFKFEVALVVDSVARAFEKAVAEGATPLATPDSKPWGQVIAYVQDLNGFTVELCTAVGTEGKA